MRFISLVFFIVLFILRMALFARILLGFLPPMRTGPGKGGQTGRRFVAAVMFVTEPLIYPIRHFLNKRDARREKIRVFDYSPILALLAIELFIIVIYNT